MTEMEKNLRAMKKYTRFEALNNRGEKCRCMKEDEDSYFVYLPRKRRLGHRYTMSAFICAFSLVPAKDPTTEWHKRLRRAVNALDQSGLWPDLKVLFENLLRVTWEEKREIQALWDDRYYCIAGKSYEKSDEELALDMKPYYTKYPFMFTSPSQLDTSYIYELSDCRIESMYFGKYWNKTIKEELKKAIEEKKDYPYRQVRANYDVSVQIDQEKRRGWYSCEYYDCGNGYYYLLLNDKIAVFCEKD